MAGGSFEGSLESVGYVASGRSRVIDKRTRKSGGKGERKREFIEPLRNKCVFVVNNGYLFLDYISRAIVVSFKVLSMHLAPVGSLFSQK